MEEKKKSQKGRVKKSRRHPIGQRLIAGLLCLCLSILSMPIDDYGNFVLAAQGKEIVMFPALPREVRTQTVTAGTSVDKLDLLMTPPQKPSMFRSGHEELCVTHQT